MDASRKNNWVFVRWIFAKIRNALFTMVITGIVLFILSGFSYQNFNWYMFSLPGRSLRGVAFHTEFENYSPDSETGLFYAENNSEHWIGLLSPSFLEKCTLGTWRRVGWDGKVQAFNAMSYGVAPGNIYEESFAIHGYFGSLGFSSLDEGRYRILTVYDCEGKTYTGIAEFTISADAADTAVPGDISQWATGRNAP